MEIRETREYLIITPLSSVLDLRESERLFSEINLTKKKPALDMNSVTECSIYFLNKLIEYTKSKDISLFNINSDVFALFNFMKIDKFAKLFVSELDFIEDSRQIINRNFLLLRKAS